MGYGSQCMPTASTNYAYIDALRQSGDAASLDLCVGVAAFFLDPARRILFFNRRFPARLGWASAFPGRVDPLAPLGRE